MTSRKMIVISAMALALAGCAEENASPPAVETDIDLDAVFIWPANLKTLGTYPSPGNYCRRLAPTPTTKAYLENGATLVGCPSLSEARAIKGTVVGTISGVTLVSVTDEEVAVGSGDHRGDTKVSGASFDAVASIPCSGVGSQVTSCNAGVQRGSQRVAVDITLPGDKLRTLLFAPEGEFITAVTSRADGSADYLITSKRAGEWTEVTVGPEKYRLPNTLILGE